MCRVCGQMVKCIFDSMPSRLSGSISTSTGVSRFISTRPSSRASIQFPQRKCLHTMNSATGTTRSHSIARKSSITLPMRSNLHQATATQQATFTTPIPPSNSDLPLPVSTINNGHNTVTQNPSATADTSQTLISEQETSKPLVLSKSVQNLIDALCAQQQYYITAHIHRFPYLLQKGDTLRLPFHMKGVNAGDILRLNRASILGSRDYTLKAGMSSSTSEMYDAKRTGEPNYLDERLFELRARVVGVESGPMFVKEKTKRRNRKVKKVKSKHRYTVLKIMDLKVKNLDELMQEKGTVLLES